MSINIESIKAKLEALSGKGGGKKDGVNYFKSQEDFSARIIPIPGAEDVMQEFNWHYKLDDKKYFICNKRSFGTACAACETASMLWQEFEDSDRKNAQFGDLAKRMFATNRYYAPIIVRGQEAKGPMIHSFGPTLAKAIYGEILNPENEGKFLDLDEGYDLNVKFTDKKGSTFKDISATSAKKSSPLVNKALKDHYGLKTSEEVMEKISLLVEGNTEMGKPHIHNNRVKTEKMGNKEGNSCICYRLFCPADPFSQTIKINF